MTEPKKSCSSESIQTTRVEVIQKTVGITLPRSLLSQARKHRLNISRVTVQTLNSFLDYLNYNETSISSNPCSPQRDKAWARSSARLERRTLNP
jgi:hypothetical protein